MAPGPMTCFVTCWIVLGKTGVSTMQTLRFECCVGPLKAEWEGMQVLSLLRLEYNALTGMRCPLPGYTLDLE